MRLNQIYASMNELGIKNLLVSDPNAIAYAIDKMFHVSERFIGLLLQEEKAVLFLNQLFPYVNEEIEIVRFHDIEDPIKLVVERINGDELSVDRNLASGFLLRMMKQKPKLKISEGSFAIDRIRAKKSVEEQDKMRIASRLNDQVMGEVRQKLKIGVRETEIAEFIRKRCDEVADGVSFDPIVAFGPATSDPHAEPSDRVLEAGMPIIIDMGCKKDNYCSDMTRSFSALRPWNQEVYELVREANLAGIRAVKPGVKLSEIDAASRRIIEEAGYGEYFVHRLGHGIGQEVHEPFDVSGVSEIIAFEGMCFSIEPGIYLPGIGGVRIEDLVLVTSEGCEVLNAYPKELEIIG